jgi:hypothetical protein
MERAHAASRGTRHCGISITPEHFLTRLSAAAVLYAVLPLAVLATLAHHNRCRGAICVHKGRPIRRLRTIRRSSFPARWPLSLMIADADNAIVEGLARLRAATDRNAPVPIGECHGELGDDPILRTFIDKAASFSPRVSLL